MDQTNAASNIVFNALLPEDIHWMESPSLLESACLADIVKRLSEHSSEHAPYVIPAQSRPWRPGDAARAPRRSHLHGWNDPARGDVSKVINMMDESRDE